MKQHQCRLCEKPIEKGSGIYDKGWHIHKKCKKMNLRMTQKTTIYKILTDEHIAEDNRMRERIKELEAEVEGLKESIPSIKARFTVEDAEGD